MEKIEVGPKEYPDGIVKATHRNQPYRQSIRIFYKFIGEMACRPVRDFPWLLKMRQMIRQPELIEIGMSGNPCGTRDLQNP